MDALPTTFSSSEKKIDNDKWNNWDETDKKIPYKNKIKGQGSGEERIANLFKTKPKGQNVPYDIDLPNYYKNQKGEVKELDSANTFKVGRDGRDRLRPIKALITKLLEILNNLVYENSNYIIDSDIKEKMRRISKISPDEICKSNISSINEICKYLYDLKDRTYKYLPHINTYDSITGVKSNVHMLDAYAIMIAERKSVVDIKKTLSNEQFDFVNLLTIIEHPYINDTSKMNNDLNGICDMFKLSTLIFVNEKGYYILCSNIKDKICFERITLGKPRFKVHLEIL